MISFTNTHLSERDGLLSLSISLVNHMSGRSYTFRCQLRRDEPLETVDTVQFEKRRESLGKSMDGFLSRS